jgi:hypothetical protein
MGAAVGKRPAQQSELLRGIDLASGSGILAAAAKPSFLRQ